MKISVIPHQLDCSCDLCYLSKNGIRLTNDGKYFDLEVEDVQALAEFQRKRELRKREKICECDGVKGIYCVNCVPEISESKKSKRKD